MTAGRPPGGPAVPCRGVPRPGPGGTDRRTGPVRAASDVTRGDTLTAGPRTSAPSARPRPARPARSSTARRTAAAGLALAAALGTVAAATGPAQAAPADPASAAEAFGGGPATAGVPRDLLRFHQQRLDWRSCVQGPADQVGAELEKAGAACADVTVPLDYRDPRGRTITVAVSRIRATSARDRIGSLLLNDGGPGGATLGAPPRVRDALKGNAGRWDIIGMDPRFVGRSTPVDCGWPVGTSLSSAGTNRAGFERQIAHHKDLAAKCRANAGDLLPHAGTRNTARDMDVVRGALGERRISYLGVSYGTYLGTVYTQMFPGRYDRMVLDGALDPRTYGPALLPSMLPENEAAYAAWAAWVARRHDTYGLGRTAEEVTAGILRTVGTAAERPLVVGSGDLAVELDDTRVPLLLFMGLAGDSDEERAALADQMSTVARVAAGEQVTPSEGTTAVLRFAFSGDASPVGSSNQAIMCADGTTSRDPEDYWRRVERSRAGHPLFGPLLNNINPCAFWDAPREARTEVRRDADVMIVAATGDPRTTYRDSTALHRLLPSSRLVTLKGANQHALFGFYGNACVDDAVNRYLAGGRLPASDLTCAKR
ncbi:alpha/beta fold hydrolase [Kitasatospora sp. NPDC056327]|uniref:alpha/beta fold hydrolase n=1 Tax=Kitasatospora sp. NPDC056327 TaxID=3345785 RepID=UPI0035D6C6FF